MAEKKIVYQIYLFTFMEKGVSPLAAATQHLKRVKALGVDSVWVGPIFPSPWKDHGYDIKDHFDIEPRFGTLEEFDAFLTEAHALGLEVYIDFVPNHTSVEHRWFQDPLTRQKYYCWSEEDRPGWKNLFNGGPAWTYCQDESKYYLHLFHESQADLNWFPDGPEGEVNWSLVKACHKIIDFWLERGVDGFRLDVPQSINKDLAAEQYPGFQHTDQAVRVLNALFGNTDCFLMQELFDPSMGELTRYYLEHSPVDSVLNVSLKDEITVSEKKLLQSLSQLAQIPGFMLDLESHDAPRFPSRGATVEDEIWYLFHPDIDAICLYQGQELGLKNPTKEQLPDHKMLDLDAQTEMRLRRGELLDDLRPTSRANARIPLDLEYYQEQEGRGESYLNLFKAHIARWRTGK